MKEEERGNCHHCVANEPLQANLTDISEPHKRLRKAGQIIMQVIALGSQNFDGLVK